MPSDRYNELIGAFLLERSDLGIIYVCMYSSKVCQITRQAVSWLKVRSRFIAV